MKVRKAIIPAAGLGTRFLPATKAQPKEMLPIVDKPTIQYIIEEAVASGIEDIIIISGRGKQTIENHFDRSIELEMELEKTGKTDYLKMVREIADMADCYVKIPMLGQVESLNAAIASSVLMFEAARQRRKV